MDALKSLGGGVSAASGYAFQVMALVATLAIVYMLAGPAWGAVVALAGTCANVMQSSGMALLGALGVLGLAKYLSSSSGS